MDERDQNERRKSRRFPFREDIFIDGAQLCTSMDISRGGLYVSAIQSFDKDTVINVTIPFGGEKITVKAQVQYCQPGIGMGIRFVELSDDQKAAIEQLIESLSKQ
jgi:hypothetical protein